METPALVLSCVALALSLRARRDARLGGIRNLAVKRPGSARGMLTVFNHGRRIYFIERVLVADRLGRLRPVHRSEKEEPIEVAPGEMCEVSVSVRDLVAGAFKEHLRESEDGLGVARKGWAGRICGGYRTALLCRDEAGRRWVVDERLLLRMDPMWASWWRQCHLVGCLRSYRINRDPRWPATCPFRCHEFGRL